jgi:hypothetical protein
MSKAEFILSSMNAHQVLMLLVVDARVLGCVADSLQEGCFACISPTDYEDTKASIFCSEIIGGILVAHCRCGLVGLRTDMRLGSLYFGKRVNGAIELLWIGTSTILTHAMFVTACFRPT